VLGNVPANIAVHHLHISLTSAELSPTVAYRQQAVAGWE